MDDPFYGFDRHAYQYFIMLNIPVYHFEAREDLLFTGTRRSITVTFMARAA